MYEGVPACSAAHYAMMHGLKQGAFFSGNFPVKGAPFVLYMRKPNVNGL